ncbi:MAG: hypothetical protein QOG20_5897 [Pseudonocardiales bacterium]|jgi:hypothetical protein|uniref:hypothetical protein n=1 Tax=Pseudonocardia sp. TaxID=60912 RepID=UPI0026121445|nr:hypothetical protein [Pseudonocardia sp.]MCW2722465.1 hypothetical protein [Pseudonocardia sp.]MDT7618825.1 hypothetical protein [Pseudonocardiales bacterium]MDT7710290.1 hypothetical protein [Pseudonocardiales bacterium]
MTSTQIPEQRTADALGEEVEAQRERIVALRDRLLAEQDGAASPAVARALEMADAYVFLALGYLGHTDELFPGEI